MANNTRAEQPEKLMTPGRWALLGIIVLLLISWTGYNSLATKDEAVNASISEIKVQEKRRYDLIPNLVKTVQAYAQHESTVFKQVTEARAQIGKVVINVDSEALAKNPELMKQFQAAQDAMSSALSRLIALQENYPQLKANENFMTLQKQIEGTENRIATVRRDNVKVTQTYNTARRTFPGVIFARLFEFRPKAYFDVPEAESKAPEVDFNKK